MPPKQILYCALVPALLIVALVGCPGTQPSDKFEVTPKALNFGSYEQRISIAVFNGGSLPANWVIQESIEWMSVEGGISGVIPAHETIQIRLLADRSNIAPGAQVWEDFTLITGSVSHEIRVAITAPGTPVLNVQPTIVNLLNQLSTATVSVTNTGTGVLAWQLSLINPDDPTGDFHLPGVVTLTPSGGGSTLAGITSSIQIDIDRDLLENGLHQFILRISSNGGTIDVQVNISQGLGPAIGVDTNTLDFGTTSNMMTFNVFNAGYQTSTLNFTLTTDRPDMIFLNPTSGTSQGATIITLANMVPITVMIRRDALQSQFDGGTIYVSADGLDPVPVIVSVEGAPLTFEGAKNRSRPPFIMRFVFLLRDMAGNAIDSTDSSILEELQSAFTVSEDEILLDADETNIFVTGVDKLKTDVVLLLDYTGSMYAAARANDSTSPDPLQALYAGNSNNGLVAGFLEALPERFSVALMEYHERQQTNRLLHVFASGADRNTYINTALNQFRLSQANHGASEIWDALMDCIDRLEARDQGVLSLDDADVRALVFITDGRDTSSIETYTNIITRAQEARVRLYPIGFGNNVQSTPLLEMALETGGHYYPAQNITELLTLLQDDPDTDVENDGTVPTDLQRQIVLTYNTLFQEGSHTYLIEANFRGNTGFFESDAEYSVGGDVRAGQITLWTDGITIEEKIDGSKTGVADVHVRTDYVPRDINEFRFRVFEYPSTNHTITVTRATDGLLDETWWVAIDEELPANDPLPQSQIWSYYFTGEPEQQLPFAIFGDLLTIRVEGFPVPGDADYDVQAEFPLQFRVDNRNYVNPPFTKFFQYPDILPIRYTGKSLASQIPILIDSGFNPDAQNAWDRDLDGVIDFNDTAPDDEKQP